MNAFVERHIGAPQGVERERADHVGGIDQNLGRQQRQRFPPPAWPAFR